ncbi:hypothetical protein LAZ67_2004306 [Cordylochernes scorpioides]|uniref:Uncharacterized protein n=1 Tax=Cordylochernes scorpioides TaxID=51811 RepID=A0ABY6K3P1_9ARAC|nr:hypothetical protein LAZ67_2004306 [Cordylochernes scorpioides]
MDIYRCKLSGEKPFYRRDYGDKRDTNHACRRRLTPGFHRRVKAKTSFQDNDVPIDDTTTKPLFTPQQKGRKGTRDKVTRLRWNPWQKHVRSMDGWLRHTSRAFQIAVSLQVMFDEICPAPSLILMFVPSCSIMLIPVPPLLRVRSEDPSVYAFKGRGLAFLINNLYYDDIAINIPNTLDLETQGIKVYLNQNKAIKIYNMYHPPNNTFIDDGTMAQFLTDNNIILGNSYQISSKIKVEKRPERLFMTVKMSPALIIFSMKKINMKELAYALENTDLNKTPGPDGIHGRIISNLGKIGKERLLNIFNNSWKTGKLPQDCKNATIIPIKKT